MATTPVHAPPTRRTRRARWHWAALGGPAFVVVSFLQMPFKEGFDPTRHAFSFLALGSLGWVQQVNFVVTGVLFAAAAAKLGDRRASRVRRVAVVSGGLMGAGMVLAGIFTVDPAFGFPPGAPQGAASPMSLSGAMHGVGFALSMAAWVVLLVALGLLLRTQGRPAPGNACLVVAPLLLLVPLLSAAPLGTVYLYAVVSTAFVLTSTALWRAGLEAEQSQHLP